MDPVVMMQQQRASNAAQNPPPRRQEQGHGASSEHAAPLRTVTSRVVDFMGLSTFTDSAEINRKALKQDPNVKPATEMDLEDFEAEDEHRTIHDIAICTPPADLLRRLGRGVVFYFDFIKFIWVVNAVLSVVALINIIPHLVNIQDMPSDTRPNFPTLFYLSEYDSDVRGYWVTTSVISVIIIFFLGPIYRSQVNKVLNARFMDEHSPDYVEDPFEGQYRQDTDYCVDKIEYDDNKVISREERRRRQFASAVVFICVLIVSGIINYYLQQAAGGESSESSAATYIALAITGINLAWKFLCQYLTMFERWEFWSDYRRWDLIKVFLFKICNVLVLYFVKSLQINNDTDVCPLNSMANQFWVLLLVDIFVMSVLEIVGPVAFSCVISKWAESTDGANEDAKPQFDLAEEYLEVVYRQFLVGLGMFVMPAIVWLALVGNVMEYWLDKFRMLRITQRPHKTNNTYKNVLMFFFFIVGVAILLAYPNGAVWVLSGSAGLKDRCRIFN